MRQHSPFLFWLGQLIFFITPILVMQSFPHPALLLQKKGGCINLPDDNLVTFDLIMKSLRYAQRFQYFCQQLVLKNAGKM